ncbi:MAG: hypothetical protein ACE3JK_00975 [Sporolactobacillus sp.]
MNHQPLYPQNPKEHQMIPDFSSPISILPAEVMNTIEPVVNHGLREAQHLGYQHALTEAVAISFLIGRVYDFNTVWHPGSPAPTPY